MTPSRPGFFLRAFPTVARCFGNLGGPILLRQLRADFRKTRFFLSQFLCLAVLGGALIVLITQEAAVETSTATQIGQKLFNLFFRIEYLIILVIFPAFSSTAFSEERAGRTLDLLLVTALRPAELVWGKFLASSAYCLMYVIASIPLLSISFLFGGVQLSEVFLAYAILIGMTLFVCMAGVAISACFTSSLRATITTYTLVFLLLGASIYVHQQLDVEAGAGRTVVGALAGWSGPAYSLGARHLGGLVAAAFLYLFLVTANRVRPLADDRSSPLRILTFVCYFGFIGLSVLPHLQWQGGSVGARTLSTDWFEHLIEQVALLLLAVALTFPTEDADVSRRNRGIFSRWHGGKYPLRIFAPGAFWGMVYAVFLAAAGSVLLAAVWSFCFKSHAADGQHERVVWALRLLPLYVGALSTLGWLFAASDFTPYYSRLTVTFVFVITLLLPVIFSLSKDREVVWTGWDVLWRGYYLSPITLWNALIPGDEDRSQYILFGTPITVVAMVVFASLAFIFFWAGVLVAHRKGYATWRFEERAKRG